VSTAAQIVEQHGCHFAARRGFWLEQLAVADLLLRPTRVMSCTGDPIVPAINEKILATLIPGCML
jgi:hypothetical protein